MKFFIWLLILFPLISFTQEHVYRNYTVEDGLPSSEVYFSFQDSKGYMWFATDAGVSKFNGYEFENFTTEDGLTDNTVFRITEDNKGRVWFAPFNGRFCYFENGKISEFTFSRNGDDMRWMGKLVDFFLDKDCNIWCGTWNKGVIKITSEKITYLSNSYSDYIHLFHSVKINDRYMVSSCFGDKSYVKSEQQNFYSPKKLNNLYLFQEKDSLRQKIIGLYYDKSDFYTRRSFIVGSNKNRVMTILLNKLVIHTIEEDTILQQVIDKSTLSNIGFLCSKLNNNEVWLSFRNKGVYKCVIENGELKIKEYYFPNSSITSIYIDKTNGVWFSTLNKGVYYVKNDNIQLYKNIKKEVFQLEIDTLNSLLFINSFEGKCDVVDIKNGNRDSILFIEEMISFGYNYLSNSLIWSESTINENILNGYSNGEYRAVSKGKEYTTYFKDILIEDDTIYLVNNSGLHVLSKDYEYYSKVDSKHGEFWATSLIKNGDNLWIGTKDGVKLLKKGEIKAPFIGDDLLSSSITCIEKFNDTLSLIGTKGKGVLVFNNGKVEKVINTDSGLKNNLVRSIHIDNEKTVWIGTTKGVSRVCLTKKEPEIYNLTKRHGLFSEEITVINSLRDTIFIGTNRGLMCLNRNSVALNNKPPILSINEIVVNSKPKMKDSLKLLSYTQNNIMIKYEGINYRSLGKVNYKHRLIGNGLDSIWISTQSRSIHFTLLPPGEYSFEVKAENEDEVWSETKQLSFFISPPFWKTWWFRILGLIVLSLSIYWVVSLSFKRREKVLLEKQKKADVEKKLVELELKALRSQMNPHFIFNILNSIQHFMLQNNFKDTNRYLTQFAKLIRTVLNLSEKQFITIDEELEMLKLYMNLEKMRFENGFDYQIIIDESIDVDYDEIPSMLIQPYIENAIWHGLMNKNTKGIIKVKIYLQDNYLFCIVEDNGIGINEVKKIKAKRKNLKHKSVGMRITKDRLNLINEYEGVSVEIKDLSEITPINNGTRVKIQIKI